MPRDYDMEARLMFPVMLELARSGGKGVVEHSINRAVERVGGFDALRRPDAQTLLPAFIAAWRAEMIELFRVCGC